MREEPRMNKYLLGIDVGTTGTKTLLFSSDGVLLGHAYRGYPLITECPGYCEQEADAWWRAVVETVREVCAPHGISHEVAAISFSVQGGTIVPVDAHGKPLRNAIVWNDARSAAQRQAFESEIGADVMYKTTGWGLSDGLPALSVRWLKENEPETYAGAAMYLSVFDYIALKMTGAPAVDISNAGINQFCDIANSRYDETLLSFAGIREAQLAPLAEAGTVVGHLTKEAAAEMGLCEDTLLISGLHDQYAAAIGVGAFKAGDLLIGTGTSWVTVSIGNKPDFESGASQSKAADGKWGSLISLSSGGICLEWLKNSISKNGELTYRDIDEKAADRKAAEEGLFFYPFSGKSADSTRRLNSASFVGMSLSHDFYSLARAVMEGTMFQIAWIAEEFKTDSEPRHLILTGGASKSPFWRQMAADIFGSPVTVPKISDVACVGAAVLAGVGCKIYKSIGEGLERMNMITDIVLPNPTAAEKYKALYDEYKRSAPLPR